MKCYKCKKIIRTKGAHYCPYCGTLLKVFSRTVQMVELTDENQLNRIEKMLDNLSNN